eukprot:TRINITY_DN29788_c0_g1_i1.p1 TRINITY_DN29788_c0_g1~~TRINITY_DN29788_c0_g1_i1.p1  ORF type:complete len:429 (-),score=39.83 TRINITY_DN29788_c0_g1_i1:115-1401(-)
MSCLRNMAALLFGVAILCRLVNSRAWLDDFSHLKDRFDVASFDSNDEDAAALRAIARGLDQMESRVSDDDPVSKFFWSLRVNTEVRLRRWKSAVAVATKASQNLHCQRCFENCLSDVLQQGVLAAFRDGDSAMAKQLFDFGRGIPGLVDERGKQIHSAWLIWPSFDRIVPGPATPPASKAFWNAAEIPLASRLESAFPVILAELERVLPATSKPPGRFRLPSSKHAHEHSADFLRTANDLCAKEGTGAPFVQGTPCWEEMCFYSGDNAQSRRGHWNHEHCALAPTTCAALQDLGLTGDLGLNHLGVPGKACFVVLHPNSRILAHFGTNNARLTVHLGLRIPEGSFIDVRGERRTWTAGQSLVIDDSFVHHVVNPSREDRIILIAHVWHPAVVASQHGYRTGRSAAWNGEGITRGDDSSRVAFVGRSEL